MQKACIIIPCYNEEKRLPVDKFSDFIRKSDISFCFVNDGSTDKTSKVIESIRVAFEEKVTTLELDKNVGKAEAVRQGMKSIAELRKFTFIGYLDADLSTPLFEIHNLLDIFSKTPELDLVIGSRVKLLGRKVERTSKRHYIGRLFSTVASFILKIPVYDTQCGAKLMKAETASEIFKEPFVSQWLFDVELLARLRDKIGKAGIAKHCYEYPLLNWKEIGGSKIKMKHLIKVPYQLFKIYLKY